ncbi:HotDog domain-containing protein [Gloeopeniophorella convolvens]|nr:HotDog domain-containing protein [Gloeopeniophorella convolvens]
MSDPDTVAGNAPRETKLALQRVLQRTMSRTPTFGHTIFARTRLTEAALQPQAGAPERAEGRAVFELLVEDDMLNYGGFLHGGCAALLVDVLSGLAISVVLGTSSGVSLVLNMAYHAPAPRGALLRIVNTTIAVGNRVRSSRTEIWDSTHGRLVATGVHIKMDPSPQPTKEDAAKL